MKKFSLAMMILMVLGIVGCSSTNRNVISVTTSGVGLKVSYSPDTKLPDFWAGGICNFMTIVPTQLNTDEDEDASNAVDMLSSQSIRAGVMNGISVDNRYTINHSESSADATADAKVLFGAPTARFLDKE